MFGVSTGFWLAFTALALTGATELFVLLAAAMVAFVDYGPYYALLDGHVESRDGHSWENWRDRLRDGLSWIFPGPQKLVYE